MRVLWIVNLVPREMAEHLGVTSEVLGGWVESMAAKLRVKDDLEIAIACRTSKSLCFNETINNTRYYSVSYNERPSLDNLKKRCNEIIDDFSPDLIQIEGTEFLHAEAMLTVGNSRNIPTLVSLQGILNGYYQYQCGQLPITEMMFSTSIKNIVTAWYLYLRQVKWFKPRMKHEQNVISKAKYLMGRTSWDRAHSYKLNPDAKYFTCCRILRKPFYEYDWKINNIERHSIYVGNGYNALKGAHFVIQALPQLIKEYPDIKLYIAGYKAIQKNDKRPFYKKGYGLYLEKLIKDLGVEDHIEFTGPLKAEQVAEKLSKVHAYVLCSAIENSPNTLGEAMCIGTPSVAAYVGGVSDMATDSEEALFYRNDDPALLAWNIKRIFDDDKLAHKLSQKGRKRARITHDADNNSKVLYEIYKEILNVN